MAFTPEQEIALLALLNQQNKTISDLEVAPALLGDMLLPVENGAATYAVSIDDIKNYIQSNHVGFVEAFSSNTPPTGWLECNGVAISRTTYISLYTAIGTTYGVGDGLTTFNIPDLRGEFIRGWDNGKGVDSGRVFGSSQLDALQNITGSIEVNCTNEQGAFYKDGPSIFSGSYYNPAFPQSLKFDASRVARTSTETRGKNVAFIFCIKY